MIAPDGGDVNLVQLWNCAAAGRVRIVAGMKALLVGAAASLAAVALGAAEPVPALDLGGGVPLELVLVRAGEFSQGSPPGEAGRGADEEARRVRLTEDFCIGRTAVTRGQWRRFVEETRYRSEAETGTSGGYGWDGGALVQRREFTWRNPGFPQDDSHPVCIVTWPDAEAFCRWLAGRTGRHVSLPTEAQWEFACRAGTTTAWHAGDDPAAADRVAWHQGNAGNGTRPAASRAPNPWGLVIGGNVAEWCRDWYAPYPAGPATDPLQQAAPAGDKPRRVLRGGSWLRAAKNTRSAARFRSDPRSRNADVGFRIVCSTAPLAAAPAPRPPRATPPAPEPRSAAPAGAAPPRPAHANSSPPAAPPRVRARGFPLLGLLCLAAPLVLIVVLVKLARRGAPRVAPRGMAAVGAGPAARGGPLDVRVVDDGFWVRSDWPPGTPLELGYTVGGEVRRQRIVYQPGPGGQYVFTGKRPSSVVATVADEAPDSGAPPLPPVVPVAPVVEPPGDERRGGWRPPPRRPTAY